jgi:hypothetical protein
MKNKYYYKDGSFLHYYDISKLLHREDGPAIERADGYKAWWVNGKLHRVDGPAVEYAGGSRFWCVDGKLHRVDGPAIEHANGTEWWSIDDKNLTEEEFNNHPQVRHYKFQLLLEEVLNEE